MEHDNVNHPKHYTEGFAPVNIECIDITRHMGFCLGNAFKYVWRAGKKGGKEKAVEDLEKAKWYIREGRLEKAGEAAQAVFRLIPEPPFEFENVGEPDMYGNGKFRITSLEFVRYQLLQEIVSPYDGKDLQYYMGLFKRFFEENSK